MSGSSRSSSSSKHHPVINFISGCLAFIALGGFAAIVLFVPQFYVIRDPICRVTHIKLFCRGILDVQTVQVDQDTMYVGLSDGNFAFDIHDPNGDAKRKAIDEYQAGNFNAAIQDWTQAIDTTTDDAESMIYIENARIEAAHQPYITIIVATTLSEIVGDDSTSISVARDDLRGAYLAQKTFNAEHSDLKIRLVLANLGVKAQDHLKVAMAPVLGKIEQLASTDNTVVGVVGFPFSTAAQIAIPELTNNNIPIISPSASSKTLSSPYFFRVVPSDIEQGQDAALFASQTLGAQHVLVLKDANNSYSQSLGESFSSSFSASGQGNTANTQSFILHNSNSLDAPLRTALSQNPPVDLIFIAGYGDDVNNVKNWLTQHNTRALIMGGDASYELGAFQAGNYSKFFFSAFTYPDTWNILCPNNSECATLKPSALSPDNYIKTFDPEHKHTGEYGYARPGPHVFLSYDATKALLQAALNALPQTSNIQISRPAIKNALQHISFQGASGQISFRGSNPVNKAVMMLCVDHKHTTHLIRIYGNFAKGARNFRDDPAIVCA